MPSLPLAKSSAKSVTPPDATLCTRNLSLHPATSAGQSRCACMMTCTICVAPGATNPVLGFTQYFFGAVVFTLNASSAVVGLYRRSSSGSASSAHWFFVFGTRDGDEHGSVSRSRAESARGGGDRTRDARAVSRREPSPRDSSRGPPGRRCRFPTPGGTRRVPKGAKCAARDPGRAARGDARRNLSSLSGLIWRPSAIVADARVPGASRQASVREICGTRSTRRVPKRNESFARRRASFGAQANSHQTMRERRKDILVA